MIHGGILSGTSILNAIMGGDINISPFDPEKLEFESRVNPASYDLTLGNQVAVYKATTVDDFSPAGEKMLFGAKIRPRTEGYLDVSKPNDVTRFTMGNQGMILMPGVGYLMHTAERIHTDKYVPIIDGKSSIGRLFCFIHVTAGYGDPGFDGQYTLEVVVMQPLRVYPGMRFCQMRFHTLVGKVDSYKKKGNYQGELAEGPVPSRSWKMFEDESVLKKVV